MDKRLLLAVTNGNVATVLKLLTKQTVDINRRDDHGLTLLNKAAFSGRVEVVALLLEANANPNATAADGKTPLQDAAMNGHLTVVEMLLKAKADIHAADHNGHTALHKATSRGHLHVVKALLKANANVHLLNKFGRTPLHHACMWYRSEIAQVLLAHGCDPHVPDNEGHKPLHLCIVANRQVKVNIETVKTLQVLVSNGIEWDAKCGELIAKGKGRKEAPALRICVQHWIQEYRQGLPLIMIEPEIIKRGAHATQTYIDELEKSYETKHRLKICVVGPSKAGKTSLVKSLTSQQPTLVHDADRTIGIDHSFLRFTTENDGVVVTYEVTFWDFAGQNEYHVAHSLFYSKRTLYLVCVDMEVFLKGFMQAELMGHTKTQWERLMNEIIERDVLRWVRVIFTRQPDAEFVFIATKADLLTEYPKFTKEVKAFLAVKLEQVKGIVKEMKRELVEQLSENERRADMLTLYAYQKRMEERDMQEAGAVVDDVEIVEINEEVEEQENLSDSTNLLDMFAGWRRKYIQIVSSVQPTPDNSDPVPVRSPQFARIGKRWSSSDSRNGDDDHKASEATELLYVSCTNTTSVKEAKQAIIGLIINSCRSFAMPESYTNVSNIIVKMRHDASHGGGDSRVERVFAPVEPLIETLVHKIPALEAITCRAIVQTLHDLGDVLWYEDLGIALFQQIVILDPLLLIDFVRQVINHRDHVEVLAHGELKGLPFWSNLQSEHLVLAMKQVLQKFQLVHPSEGEMKWNSDLIVPAFWNSKTPASWLFAYEDVRLVAAIRNSDQNKPKEQLRVHWEYHFAHEFPDTLFDHLVMATYSPYMKRDAGPDWILYAEDGAFACRAMVGRDEKNLERVLHLEAVLAEGANEGQADELWEAFDTLSEGIVKVLRRYPGLVVISVALDDAFKMRDLEGLFNFPLKHQCRKWMPPEQSWEVYKQAVQRSVVDDDTWVLIDS